MTSKIGAVIIDLEGDRLSPLEHELLAHPLVGGVILFSRNHTDRQQLSTLCETIRASRTAPLLIMADQEGGRVQRFAHGFTRLPPLAFFGNQYDKDADAGCWLAEEGGRLMATEIRSVGIDMSLSPVLDLNKGMSQVIGERAFHACPQAVTKLASAFVHGMNSAGMAATGKHFPGHGSVALDTHTSVAMDNRTLQEIRQEDILPFKALIQAGLPAIMAAHIIFPHVDSLPVGFSKRWLKNILREELGFSGTIFSDDLNMEGANISANYVDRVVAAREAGCDFTLLCNQRQGVIEVLDNLPTYSHQVETNKWETLLTR